MKEIYKKWWFWVAIAVVVFIIWGTRKNCKGAVGIPTKDCPTNFDWLSMKIKGQPGGVIITEKDRFMKKCVDECNEKYNSDPNVAYITDPCGNIQTECEQKWNRKLNAQEIKTK